ncbi:hypothetical protein MGMO_138c00380 [Methyloglobulus morosus KoM1]|uniref:DUF3761 domain-containing protein n=1 Tax=Methyloglobulus morosus KoM1 TaxID=1116472 RepID=V5B7G7_9GAMM|nr:hypothetical protein [Methyloglobulus morosus]ESS69200.1 hypothetical protein MGMO_138c00380 [Methyloglobulus morosus KoM1]
MKIQSLLMVSIICFFCTGAFAEQAATAEPSAAVTGLCKDGSSYTGASKKGACRGHKGVKEWYGDKAATAPSTPTAAPAAEKAAPAASADGAATGLCKDGTPYTGASKKGACRGHKGIKEWYADKKAPAASEAAPVAATPAATAAPVAAAAATNGVATGLCKDGTEYTGASKRGACRGHKGVKEWYADKKEPAAESAAPTATPAAAVPAATTPTTTPAKEAKPAVETPAQVAPAAGSGKVWVNTHSKIYHCEGSKFYGKTKEGEYMSEADAQAKGYAANRKKVCN